MALLTIPKKDIVLAIEESWGIKLTEKSLKKIPAKLFGRISMRSSNLINTKQELPKLMEASKQQIIKVEIDDTKQYSPKPIKRTNFLLQAPSQEELKLLNPKEEQLKEKGFFTQPPVKDITVPRDFDSQFVQAKQIKEVSRGVKVAGDDIIKKSGIVIADVSITDKAN